jgi:hypothetical protein
MLWSAPPWHELDPEPLGEVARGSEHGASRTAERGVGDKAVPRPAAIQVAERGAARVAASPARPTTHWWSRELGLDPSDGRIVTNADDRIRVALAANLLEASDIRVLEDLIALNDLDESSSPFDRNDGDGILSAWELGFQVWRDGRLIAFSLGPDPYSSYRYGVEALPTSIEDLAQLRYLGLQQNRLSGLPAGLDRLERLEQLIAFDNQMTELPRSLFGLRSLERLVLTDNLLQELPESIGSLAALTALHLADNPLRSLPPDLSSLLRLRVLDLSRSEPGTPAGAPASVVLPADLQLAGLDEIYLGGHPSLCDVVAGNGSAITLRDGSSVRVYGARPAGCAP